MSKAQADEGRHVSPHAGPQTAFFESRADIVIYGGQAGGGKSWALVAEPLRRIHNKGFRAGVFRRTYPQLKGQGGVWDECQELYRAFGAKMREGQELDATFPSGASVAFLHLQHEKTKYEYQGHQFCCINFDELTHFSRTQFFYMLGRNRSACGIRPYIRATCNPDPASWVAEFIAWWIDQDSGFPIPERSGVLRYFINDAQDEWHWADSKAELIEQFPDYSADDILSVTFIPAGLDDNPTLVKKDPGYRGRLKALSKIERERLEKGNWKAAEGAQIASDWIHRYVVNGDHLEFSFQQRLYRMPQAVCRRIATIDTAGTSKEKAAARRGRQPSWSVCGVWDIVPHWNIAQDGRALTLSEFCFLRYVWRKQVDWNSLKTDIDETLATWNVTKAYIENAHHGQPLATEILACPTELVGPVLPGMGDSSEGAKLERAIASGMLARWEHGKFFVPQDRSDWLDAYLRELQAWTGDPEEVADQIDMTSYAAYISKRSSGAWGGVLKTSKGTR